MFLPDVNLWVALAFESHIHYSAARHWFETDARGGESSFCRLTQQGFLRLATNPRAFPGKAVNLSTAWRLYDELLDDPRVAFCCEPADLEPAWRLYTQQGTFSHKIWSDGYLAGFAQVADLELVTFDKGFTKFPGLRFRILS